MPRLLHVAQQLVALAGVEADLGDDEPGPAGDLFFELEQLRHDFVLVPLEIRRHRAGEKGRRLHRSARSPLRPTLRPSPGRDSFRRASSAARSNRCRTPACRGRDSRPPGSRR